MSHLVLRFHLIGLALGLLAAGALAQPQPERLELQTADGMRIYAFWYGQDLPENAPAVLLLHNPGATHVGWLPLLEPLRRAGFRPLALDFRGHGDSKASTPEVYEQMRQRDPKPYLDMIHDVEAGLQWLTTTKHVRPERIALVGGEHCANLAIQALARNHKLGAVVAMSPSQTYFGFPLLENAKKIKDKPLYIISPKQLYSEGTSKIEEMMRNNPKFESTVFPRFDGHGVYMLGLTWRVEDLIVKWLAGVFPEGS